MHLSLLSLLVTSFLGAQCFTGTISAQVIDPLAKPISLTGQTHKEPSPYEAKTAEQSFFLNGGSISSYPNPASARLVVAYVAVKDGDLLLRLLNRNGQQVAPEIHTIVSPGEQRQFNFDVTSLPNGTYVVRAEQNSATLFHRVIVAH